MSSYCVMTDQEIRSINERRAAAGLAGSVVRGWAFILKDGITTRSSGEHDDNVIHVQAVGEIGKTVYTVTRGNLSHTVGSWAEVSLALARAGYCGHMPQEIENTMYRHERYCTPERNRF